MTTVFSPIQNHILSKLKNAKTLRYSELSPDKKIHNDLFNYHLQFLVKKGFVEKNTRAYFLSEMGIKHVADTRLVKHNEKLPNLFKYNVICVVSRVRNGKIEILNQERKSHPSYGKIGVPGGNVRKGELVEPAATRKLKVETGLDADFKMVGLERRMLYVKGELFSDMIFPVAYAETARGELQIDTEYGHNLWVPIDAAIKNESVDFDSIKTIVSVLKLIKSKKIKKTAFVYNETVQRD